MAFFENDLKTLFPELFCIASSVALVLFGAAYGGVVETRRYGEERSTATKRNELASPALLQAPPFGLLCLFYLVVLLLNHPIGDATCCASGFVYDCLGTQCKLIMVSAALACLTVSLGVMARGQGGFECVCLMLLSISGGMLLISSGDLMSLFLSLEIQSLCFYVLAATGRTSEFSTEAGLKYLVLGAFASGVLLFGCSLLYGFSGTTSLYEVSNLAACPWSRGEGFFQGRLPALELGTRVGLLFILFGVLFKLGAAPFHSWVPDVYDGAPIFITTFFAAVPKVAILAFVLRLFAAFGGGHLFTSMLPRWGRRRPAVEQSGSLEVVWYLWRLFYLDPLVRSVSPTSRPPGAGTAHRGGRRPYLVFSRSQRIWSIASNGT